MPKCVPFLLFASRGFAICAVLAGRVAGLLASIGPSLICVDSCGQRTSLVAALNLGAVLQNMTPCIVLEALALVTFLAYCLATRQAWRAVISPLFSPLFLVVAGAITIVALNAIMQQAATLPVGDGGFLIEAPAVAWGSRLALALTLFA